MDLVSAFYHLHPLLFVMLYVACGLGFSLLASEGVLWWMKWSFRRIYGRAFDMSVPIL